MENNSTTLNGSKAQTQANRYAFLVQASNKRLLEQLLKKVK